MDSGQKGAVDRASILALLNDVKDGRLSPSQAVEQLKSLPFQAIGDITMDHHRALRRGVPEIIYGAGKTLDQLEAVIRSYRQETRPLLITRLESTVVTHLLSLFPDLHSNPLARTLRSGAFAPEEPPAGTVGVVGAGASDGSVVEEVCETLTFLSCPFFVVRDAGVAGMHRFLNHWQELSEAPVIVAVAGMEGALPSVLGGLFPGPIIGVPTSVGYGSHLGGLTPLLGMLNSCTAGIAVVNIDNGVAAGYIASLINRKR
ncbi:MAG TPA: nickel pincer cofactor biosynthesis protein LarB [Thermoanaerobaculia bacterium]|nr:nickel pincer cofactor biosynthesis protein LarB [Thermoanaerobaculia bacterium]HUM28600.1 nickel pincer cofactor biosynthesis protein LarB [Thermoanaerobaculia bacterium]HXK66792.1 nickel pincer cofactor biosynthesis protein LarB [Thermoanaerobaculia bacterium]